MSAALAFPSSQWRRRQSTKPFPTITVNSKTAHVACCFPQAQPLLSLSTDKKSLHILLFLHWAQPVGKVWTTGPFPHNKSKPSFFSPSKYSHLPSSVNFHVPHSILNHRRIFLLEALLSASNMDCDRQQVVRHRWTWAACLWPIKPHPNTKYSHSQRATDAIPTDPTYRN